MVREIIGRDIIGNVKIIAILFAVLLTATISPFSYASEQLDAAESTGSEYIEIEVVDDLNLLESEKEFFYAKSTITDYEAGSLKSRDILRTIPSINTKDNKLLGLVMPPFAYFKTKF